MQVLLLNLCFAYRDVSTVTSWKEYKCAIFKSRNVSKCSAFCIVTMHLMNFNGTDSLVSFSVFFLSSFVISIFEFVLPFLTFSKSSSISLFSLWKIYLVS